jgi:hypothetical protein
MLEDMRHPGVVRRICLESDREDIVLVFACNMQIVCASLVVLQVQSCQLEFGDMLRAEEREAVNLLSRLRILGKLCHGFPDDSLGCVAQHRGLDDWKLSEKESQVDSIKSSGRSNISLRAIKLLLYRA